MDLSEYIIYAFVPLAILIALIMHELGHLWAARLFGLPVNEVVIGAGRKIWERKDSKDTHWRIHLWPVKAHVGVVGFEDEGFPLWKRTLTVLAGSFVSLTFPVLTFIAFFLVYGQPATMPIIVGVEMGGVADKAGIQPGDWVLKVDGKHVSSYQQVREIGYDPDKSHTYTINRSEDLVQVELQPELYEFIDEDGVARSHPRLGTFWRHKPFKLEAVASVNGIDVDGDDDKARELLIRNMNRGALVGMNSTDGKVHVYKVVLYAASNRNLNNPDHRDYNHIYMSELWDDFYLKELWPQRVLAAVKEHVRLIGGVLKVPFHLFPIDKEDIQPEAMVVGDFYWFRNGLYDFIHKMALISLVIGYVNLLPLPYMDGSYLIYYLIEAVTKKPPTKRQKARGIAVGFLVFYIAIMFANLDNIPRYIDSRLQKLQEFTNTEK